MISGLQEILDAKKIMNEVMDELDKEGVKYNQDIKVGVMIEVPSAVTIADILAKHVDFFSIGSNDLIQYTLAIDRINEYVAYMYQPFHPAILRMIKQVVEVANNAGIRVGLCGQMAGDPLCTLILLGLGVNEISMNAGGIPVIKTIIRSVSMKEARANFEEILKLDTAEKVREHILKKMKPLIPDLDEMTVYGQMS